MTNFKDLKSKIIADINTKNLSKVLPNVIDFAEQAEFADLKQLCIDELYGFETETEVPEYRKIPVDFYDKYGKKITPYTSGSILSISEAMRKEYYPYREPIEELEDLAIKREIRTFIALRDPFEVKINGEKFEAHSFEYFSTQIRPSILKLKKIIIQFLNESSSQKPIENDKAQIQSLHKNIVTTSLDLYYNGHYRQAILDATIELVNQVKQKSLVEDLDNTPLMQKVFSPSNPILEISKDKNLQQGFTWLFSGAVMTFRNANAHRLNPDMTKTECIEQLTFLSYLHRVLDKI